MREASRAVGIVRHHAPGCKGAEAGAVSDLAGGEAHGADGTAVVRPAEDDDVLLLGRVSGNLDGRLDRLRTAVGRVGGGRV